MIQVSLDHTLFIQILQFLLIVFISNQLILKPIKKLIDQRDAKISALNTTTEGILSSVEDSRLAYEEKLVAVKKEIATYQDKVRQKASKSVEAVLSEAKAQIEADRAKSEKEIALAYQDAKSELDKEITELSKSVYKQLSGVA